MPLHRQNFPPNYATIHPSHTGGQPTEASFSRHTRLVYSFPTSGNNILGFVTPLMLRGLLPKMLSFSASPPSPLLTAQVALRTSIRQGNENKFGILVHSCFAYFHPRHGQFTTFLHSVLTMFGVYFGKTYSSLNIPVLFPNHFTSIVRPVISGLVCFKRFGRDVNDAVGWDAVESITS